MYWLPEHRAVALSSNFFPTKLHLFLIVLLCIYVHMGVVPEEASCDLPNSSAQELNPGPRQDQYEPSLQHSGNFLPRASNGWLMDFCDIS